MQEKRRRIYRFQKDELFSVICGDRALRDFEMIGDDGAAVPIKLPQNPVCEAIQGEAGQPDYLSVLISGDTAPGVYVGAGAMVPVTWCRFKKSP